MDIAVVELPSRRYAYLRHCGPYPEIGGTFGRMTRIAGEAGLLGRSGGLFIGVYHDDPSSTPPDELQSDAGILLVDDMDAPEGLETATLAGGKHAKGVHVGSYAKMGESWMALYEEIERRGLKPFMLPPFELYIRDMENTSEDELITELYAPIS